MTEENKVLKQAEKLATAKGWTLDFALSILYTQLQAQNKLHEANTSYRIMEKRVMQKPLDPLLEMLDR